jgi:CheY-like chemotaxis protein
MDFGWMGLHQRSHFLTAWPNARRRVLSSTFISAESLEIDLKRRLTSSGDDFPVIFMTAVDNAATRQEAVDAGCVAYLRKPFLAKLLIEAINQVA